jgi:cytochrome c-type biogenesis protein CcmH/NrfG
MNRKKTTNITALAFGALLILAALQLDHLLPKAVGGIMIGVGASLLSVSAVKLYQLRFDRKNPELAKQSQVEERDERNAMIRSRAKARAGDITQWAIMGAAYVAILMNASLWVTLSAVGCFVLYNILCFCLTVHYQKEM